MEKQTTLQQQKQQMVVEIMTLSLRYWFHTTQKGKVELAEESRLWNAAIDNRGTHQTRTRIVISNSIHCQKIRDGKPCCKLPTMSCSTVQPSPLN